MNSKALFLDRDGVINVDKGYVSCKDDFIFIKGIFSVIQHFVAQGFQPIIVTNQSGIGRGYYTEAQFESLCNWMQAQFAQEDLSPIPVYYCPHHPTEAKPPYKQDCGCRKPKPGMLLQACLEHDLNPAESVMVGDSWRDMEAANRAGVATAVLVSDATLPEQPLLKSRIVQVGCVSEIPRLIL